MAIEDLRRNRMMCHLLESLEAGCDIGHYGRLVFTMIGRHFLDEEELAALLARDPDCPEIKARALYRQVEEHDYSPPTRERILEWQCHQDFPIVPNPEDPDSANVYKDLQFPDRVYEHIRVLRAESRERVGRKPQTVIRFASRARVRGRRPVASFLSLR